MSPTLPTHRSRFADFDWLRVVAILLLHLFHTGMMFNTWEWHIKAPQLLPALEGPMHVLHLLRMPLLMLVAGAGTALALRKRSLGAFASDRVKRLLLPLAFGMFVVVPPQIYVERLFRGQFNGSYSQFWPSVLHFVPYPRGSFSWHHLWFVAYLFVFCMVSLPIFAFLARARGQALLARIEVFFAKGVNVAFLFLPLAIGRILLDNFDQTCDLIHDPNTLAYYCQLFLFGHLLGRSPAIMQRISELRWKMLAATLAVFCIMAPGGELPFPCEDLGKEAFVWGSLLTILGFARAHIKERRPWLAYAQERAYPFYILHQTVIIVVGWRLMKLSVGPWTRSGLVFGLSFLATGVLCEVIARIAWLRPLFGMPKARAPRVADLAQRTVPEPALLSDPSA